MALSSEFAEILVIKYFPTLCLALASAVCLSLSEELGPKGFMHGHHVATSKFCMVLFSLLGPRTQKDKSSTKTFLHVLNWQTCGLILQDELKKMVSEK